MKINYVYVNIFNKFNLKMKNFIVSICLSFLFFSFSAKAQKQDHYYKDDKMSCVYQTVQGRIDGKYTSYYKNGMKKAEGDFVNNYRDGKWMLWDSTGKIITERNYKNPFLFDFLSPKIQTNILPYKLKYNKDGYLDYFQLQEKMVVVEKRVWRYISVENNSLPIINNIFQKIISENIVNGNITAYSTNDDEFKTSLKPSEINIKEKHIIGYKIKEDWFFDNVRKVSESRIIGICPVAVDLVKHDTVDLYWIYFPDIRKYLAKEKINGNEIPSNIKTLDDFFFFRFFASTIYKEANFYDRKITDYKKGNEINLESERIEIDIIELEHSIWKNYLNN